MRATKSNERNSFEIKKQKQVARYITHPVSVSSQRIQVSRSKEKETEKEKKTKHKRHSSSLSKATVLFVKRKGHAINSFEITTNRCEERERRCIKFCIPTSDNQFEHQQRLAYHFLVFYFTLSHGTPSRPIFPTVNKRLCIK